MRSKTVSLLFLLCFFAACLTTTAAAIDPPFAGSFSPEGAKPFFPAWGKGSIAVRLYTDYFCPPCRAMEPDVEPILRDLVEKNTINLTLVDTPIYDSSPLYGRLFLHTLAKNTNFEHALRVRTLLFDAARNNVTTKDRVEHLLASNGIPFAAVDITEILRRLNGHLKEDKIRETPMCVIVRGGRKEVFTGGRAIISALGRLRGE